MRYILVKNNLTTYFVAHILCTNSVVSHISGFVRHKINYELRITGFSSSHSKFII